MFAHFTNVTSPCVLHRSVLHSLISTDGQVSAWTIFKFYTKSFLNVRCHIMLNSDIYYIVYTLVSNIYFFITRD